MRPVALFSLNDTSYAKQFAEQLIRTGWDIIASRETVDLLNSNNLPVQDIADFTGVTEDYGFPPTLHARVEYALTTDDVPRIDLVYVIPYPLSDGNDVGGRTLLSLAVKGGRIAVMSITDMARVILEIVETGDVTRELRLELSEKACFEIACHYSSFAGARGSFDMVSGIFGYNLLNGENPYQVPASVFIAKNDDDLFSPKNFKQVSGDLKCFTNMADTDCILHTICLAAEAISINLGLTAYICVAAKHGNACGMGVSLKSPNEAIEKALWGNPLAVWGGEVITNFLIDEEGATLLFESPEREQKLHDKSWMLDVIVSPGFVPAAISILGKRKGRKLIENPALTSPVIQTSGFTYRHLRGGFLRQPPPTYILKIDKIDSDRRGYSQNDIIALVIAWAVAFSSNHGGNEVAIAKSGALLGAAGGPSTVEAARTAVRRSLEQSHDISGSAFAADAFFPFTDGPAVLCEAGVSIGTVPAGGRRGMDVKNFFNDNGVTVVYIPEQFRGFCRH